MNATEKYFEVQQQLEFSNYELKKLIEHNAGTAEVNNEKDHNHALGLELNNINHELSLQNPIADNIRLNFINYTNELLKALIKIEAYGNQYPDLNQGMIISGYLFGMILSEYKFILTNGAGYPIPRIYMSEEKWPAVDLKTLLNQIKQELTGIQFKSLKDAIVYNERIVDRIKTQLVVLQQLGYV